MKTDAPGADSAYHTGVSSRRSLPGLSTLGLVLLAGLAFLATQQAFRFAGALGVMLATGGLLAVLVLAIVSSRDPSWAICLWLLSMSGQRTLGMVTMPGLPDFSFDRLLLIWVIIALLLRAIQRRERFQGPYAAEAFLLLHTAYMYFHIRLSGSPHIHAWVISNLSPLFAYLFGKYGIKEDRQLRNVFVFLFCLLVYYYVQSIAQHFNLRFLIWPKTILDRSLGYWPEGRTRGPVLHPPYFGQLLAVLFLVQFFFLVRARRALQRLLIGASIGLSGLGMLFTMTRGPWVAGAVALLFMSVLRPTMRRLVVVLGVLAVVVGSLGIIRSADTEFLQERLDDVNTVENRFGFFVNALRMIRDHPLTGIGYLKFAQTTEKYNQTSYVPLFGLVRKRMGADVPAHDIYLGRFAEEGFLSILLLGLFALAVLRAGVRQWQQNPQDRFFNRDMLVVMFGMQISFLVGGMVIDYRYFDLINVLFTFVSGVLVGYVPKQTLTGLTAQRVQGLQTVPTKN